ncbi:hypothetical protein BP6252_13084 [Coleophoma cylindrospora]|uniref:Uncharacterized protein n=1 Tax=Coleophoma cylindrospora TaxID=1849047 RepID=A0A3D8QAH0_9HELO|nr:hypothetical protein BP6252_13084 [Coleophoma cylindrospora]
MQLSVAIILAMASMAIANPLAGAADIEAEALVARAACNGIGNCDKNGCEGTNTLFPSCTAGKYLNCPCGYGCGPVPGPCNKNGCNGFDNRCIDNYKGCACT